MKDDGTTACGCWIYSGVFPEPGRNRANERKITDNPLQPEWGFAWPNNVRVLYNRASADPEGRPWSERKKLVWWDAEKRRWVGLDVPIRAGQAARLPTASGRDGHGRHRGHTALHHEGRRAGLAVRPQRIKDGPLPRITSRSSRRWETCSIPTRICNPTVRFFEGPLNPIAHTPTTEYPVVATTFRLTEHYLSGPMSRFNSWLNELQPAMFVELSPSWPPSAALFTAAG